MRISLNAIATFVFLSLLIVLVGMCNSRPAFAQSTPMVRVSGQHAAQIAEAYVEFHKLQAIAWQSKAEAYREQDSVWVRKDFVK